MASHTLTAEPVAVFISGRQDLIVIAESVLRDAGIEYGVDGEAVQDILGWGRFPTGSSVLAGPMRVLVSADLADDAMALLEGLGNDEPLPPCLDDVIAIEEDAGDGLAFWRFARTAARWIAALVLAYFALEAAVGLYLGLLNR